MLAGKKSNENRPQSSGCLVAADGTMPTDTRRLVKRRFVFSATVVLQPSALLPRATHGARLLLLSTARSQQPRPLYSLHAESMAEETAQIPAVLVRLSQHTNSSINRSESTRRLVTARALERRSSAARGRICYVSTLTTSATFQHLKTNARLDTSQR